MILFNSIHIYQVNWQVYHVKVIYNLWYGIFIVIILWVYT